MLHSAEAPLSQPEPYARLSRDDAAAALRAAGFTITSATLATRAARRTGPPTEMFSGRPVYEWSSTLAWARNDVARKAAYRRQVA